MHCMKLNELFALFFLFGNLNLILNQGENSGFYILKLNVILLNRIRDKLSLLQTVGVW